MESLGKLWCRCDGPGVAWMDVVPPGWTWRPRNGRAEVGSVLRGSALSPEGRHCHQRVGTVTRGSALSPEGRHCHKRVGTVARRSTA